MAARTENRAAVLSSEEMYYIKLPVAKAGSRLQSRLPDSPKQIGLGEFSRKVYKQVLLSACHGLTQQVSQRDQKGRGSHGWAPAAPVPYRQRGASHRGTLANHACISARRSQLGTEKHINSRRFHQVAGCPPAHIRHGQPNTACIHGPGGRVPHPDDLQPSSHHRD